MKNVRSFRAKETKASQQGPLFCNSNSNEKRSNYMRLNWACRREIASTNFASAFSTFSCVIIPNFESTTDEKKGPEKSGKTQNCLPTTVWLKPKYSQSQFYYDYK